MDKEMMEFLEGMETRLSSQISEIKSTQIQMEQTLGDYKVLFDGYNQLNKNIEDIKENIEDISSKLEKQQVEIKVIKGAR